MRKKILWKGRNCFRGFLPIILVGVLTSWVYGIGIIFIAYAILKWIRVTYLITDKKIVKIIEHYAFYRIEKREIRYEEVQDLKNLPIFTGKNVRILEN